MRRKSRQDRYGWRSDLRAYDPASSSPSGCVEQLHSSSESRPLSTRIGSFVWRCVTGSAVAPFPHPAHRTGLADCPHPALPPAMQHRKQPFWARLQLLARLTLNAGKHTANQPARLAQLDDGNDRAIVVQGDEGPAQVVRLGHRGTPSVKYS